MEPPRNHWGSNALCIFFPGSPFYWPMDISGVLSPPTPTMISILCVPIVSIAELLGKAKASCVLSAGNEKNTTCSTGLGCWHHCNGSETVIRSHSLTGTDPLLTLFCCPHWCFFLDCSWPSSSLLSLSHHILWQMLQLPFSGSGQQNLYIQTWAAVFPSLVTALLSFQCQRPECHLWWRHSSYQILEQFKLESAWI